VHCSRANAEEQRYIADPVDWKELQSALLQQWFEQWVAGRTMGGCDGFGIPEGLCHFMTSSMGVYITSYQRSDNS
jgi:hypothetical protein